MDGKKEKFTEVEMGTKLEKIAQTDEFEVAGETEIADKVIAAIAGMAAREVDGVVSLGTSSLRQTVAEAVGGAEGRARGVQIEAGKKEAIIDLTLNVAYGFSIPNVIVEIRKKVASRLQEMVGLFTKEINVNVASIEFPDRMPGKVE